MESRPGRTVRKAESSKLEICCGRQRHPVVLGLLSAGCLPTEWRICDVVAIEVADGRVSAKDYK